MRTIKVKLKERSYDIMIGSGILSSLGKYIRGLDIGSDAYIITNAAIKKRYGAALEKNLKKYGFGVKFKLVPDTEKSKSLETTSSVISDISAYDLKKRVFIIAFGGGVIGDLAGFVASIYKRGVPYVQVPTTLLAQVDSSIGGKTAVDLRVGKNLVGAFYQPRLVFADVSVLKTLDLRQIRSALAEVIKYGIIKDGKLFKYLEERHKDIFALKIPALEFIVTRCAAIKAKITAQDEREEKGIRTILNFGHTLGHAIEASGGFDRYNHGEAVALGMLVAADISSRLLIADDRVPGRIERLSMTMGLPVRIKKVSISRIMGAHFRDKKFIGRRNRFVLIKDIGRALVVENIPVELVRSCLSRRLA